MKKIFQVALVVVVAFGLLQAAIGGVFVSADRMASLENPQYVTASSSVQSIQVLICSSRRLVGCVLPNVGWNS
jgi:hypothetical protein